jgi:endonuclease YncB( thermonuclease family)
MAERSWAGASSPLRTDVLRIDLARRLHGTVETDAAVETGGVRAVVTVLPVRAGVLRVTIRRHDRARLPVTVETPVDGIDVCALVAVARTVSRTPWRALVAVRALPPSQRSGVTTMSTTPHTVRSVRLAARVTTLLARTFPEYVPGKQDGFRVESLDQQEPRRMFVRWYGGTRTRPVFSRGPALGIENDRARLAEALVRDGYAVTLPPGSWGVYVDDRPVNHDGPRYAAVPNDIPLTEPWLVVDSWTRVHAATAATEGEAKEEAMRLERVHALTDARLVTAPELWPHLEAADELLGDGLAWLYREMHDGVRYGPLKRRERLDALVDVANALRRGEEIRARGRMVSYETPNPMIGARPADTYEVQWAPKSAAPAVGFFPHPEWLRGPAVGAAVTVLMRAGLHPAVYGEPIGTGQFLCEQPGFMVSATDPHDLTVPGVSVSTLGPAETWHQHIPVVLREAGWQVEEDESWPGRWLAHPSRA